MLGLSFLCGVRGCGTFRDSAFMVLGRFGVLGMLRSQDLWGAYSTEPGPKQPSGSEHGGGFGFAFGLQSVLDLSVFCFS